MSQKGGVFSWIGRLLRGAWRTLDALRRLSLNLLFVLILLLVVSVLWAPKHLPVPEGSALLVRPSGILVERVSNKMPWDLLGGGDEQIETSLPQTIEALRAAVKDTRIKLVALETDALEGAGLGQLQELRTALSDLRAAGKPVYAWGRHFSQAQYFLASAADQVFMAPDGFVLVRGLSRYNTYFKGALDTLGVKMHVFRAGQYKSFAEPYTRTNMSEEDRFATQTWLSAAWGIYRDEINQARKLRPGQLDAWIENYKGHLEKAGGDPARMAKEAGLIDEFKTASQWKSFMVSKVGEDLLNKHYKQISTSAYLNRIESERVAVKDKIGVVIVQGPIVDGAGNLGSAGAQKVVAQLDEMAQDDDIKAILLRIDSPGGSVTASEAIRQAVLEVKTKGKPVVASMGAVAASGGYWIATAADEIWANAGTLTGSIGVFALYPEISQPLEKLGLTVDGVATSRLAGAMDLRRPLDEEAGQALQMTIEHTYNRFLNLVEQARKLPPETTRTVAEGRVWIGSAAKENGLVDNLGGMEAAIERTASLAKLTSYERYTPEPDLLPQEELMRLFSNAYARWQPNSQASQENVVSASFQGFERRIKAEWAQLSRWNDPQHTYAHCFCNAP